MDDKEETIEEEIEFNEQNQGSPDPLSVKQAAAEAAATNSKQRPRGGPLEEYPSDIPFSASLKRKTEANASETGHFNPSSSNNQTFGRRSRIAEAGEDSAATLDRADPEEAVNQ